MKRILSVVATVFLLIILIGCSHEQPPAPIAATTLPVHEFTSWLCRGTGIAVTRLVTENVSCLHDYSLSVRQVKAVESAHIVIVSGAGLEDFMNDVLQNAALVIDSAYGIDLLECADPHGHDHAHEHTHEHDPHLWLSPECAGKMAMNICSALKARYPQHTVTFEANLKALLLEIDALMAYGRQQLQELSCREMITFHDGFSYFADAFGLTILEAVEEESGSEASAAELKRLITLVRSHALPAVFTERNGSTAAAQIIAAETEAQIYALDMAMSGSSYFEAMYHNIDTVKEALE